MKKCVINVEYCNSSCPYFYHNYYDLENIYCDLLNKKVYDCQDDCNATYDINKRAIPNNCPLEDV